MYAASQDDDIACFFRSSCVMKQRYIVLKSYERGAEATGPGPQSLA